MITKCKEHIQKSILLLFAALSDILCFFFLFVLKAALCHILWFLFLLLFFLQQEKVCSHFNETKVEFNANEFIFHKLIVPS